MICRVNMFVGMFSLVLVLTSCTSTSNDLSQGRTPFNSKSIHQYNTINQYPETSRPEPDSIQIHVLPQGIKEADYGNFLIQKVKSANLNSEDSLDWKGDVWKHLLRYDGKYKILAAAYQTKSDKKMQTSKLVLFEGDLATLGKDLFNPDTPVDGHNGARCEDYLEAHPRLWLLTEDGAIFQPRWPRDRCMHNQPPVSGINYPFVTHRNIDVLTNPH